MSLIKSILYNIKEARFNPVSVFHGILYSATVTYLRILKRLMKLNLPRLRRHTENTYHSKVLRLEDAKKIITVNKNIELRNLDRVLPFKHAKDLILRNPHNIVAYECACRAQKKDSCKPGDVCLIVGEPFVDLVRMMQPFRSRRISPEEALQILKDEDERGHIHTAWFKTAMLNRFYAICNCCSCCCLGLKFMSEYTMRTVLPSGYLAVIGEECIGCGVCAKSCQFNAIEIQTFPDNGNEKKIAVVEYEKCFGCGICEGKCKQGVISLVRDEKKGVPLDIQALEQSESVKA